MARNQQTLSWYALERPTPLFLDSFIVQVAHGHLLRAFAKRWLKYPMETPLSMMMEPGGIGILRHVIPVIQAALFIFKTVNCLLLDFLATNITALPNQHSCWEWGFRLSGNRDGIGMAIIRGLLGSYELPIILSFFQWTLCTAENHQ